MSVSKNRATSLLKSEKKTLISFLLLYAFFSLVILLFSSFIYYNIQKDNMLQNQNDRLQEYSSELIDKLKYLHYHFDQTKHYPRFVYFNSAIYDSSGKVIFSTLKQNHVKLENSIYKIGDKIHYVRLLESYYLGAMYVVIEIVDDEKWLGFVKLKVVFYGITLFLILLFAGYFLFRLFLKPMRDSINLLDSFIKDTTHELNTPVSSILANIEMIDFSNMDSKNIKKIKRIEIASRTISHLYNDLTFVALGNHVESKNVNVNLTKLIKERAEYFKVISAVRDISCHLDLEDSVYLYIDEKKIRRVVDNIISNSIKYNKKGSFINIVLKKGLLSIEDGGIGIEKDKIDKIYDRYSRFNESEGGFGLGLNIVYAIVQEYGLKLNIESKVGKGTKVTIRW